jgi:hypothetical protein
MQMNGFKTTLVVGSLSFLVAIVFAPSKVQCQVDIDNDGRAEAVLVSAIGDQYDWVGYDITNGSRLGLGRFAPSGALVNLGTWTAQSELSRVFLVRNSFNQFLLQSEDAIEPYAFGDIPSRAHVLLSRDIDSSGFNDMVVIGGDREKWSWRLSFDPLRKETYRKRILFGSVNEIPFVFRSRGKQDSIGVLRRRGVSSKITYRHMSGNIVREIRLRGFEAPDAQPLVLRDKGGLDYFAFVKNT